MENETIDKLKNAGYITVTDDSQGIADKVGIGGGGGSDAASVLFNNFFKNVSSDFIQPQPTKVLIDDSAQLADVSEVMYPEKGMPQGTNKVVYFLYKEEDASKIITGLSKAVVSARITSEDNEIDIDYVYALNGLQNQTVDRSHPVEIDEDTYYRIYSEII